MPAADKASAEFHSLSRSSLTLDGKPFSDYLEGLLVDAGVGLRRIASGEIVFQEGDPGDSAYFIRTGSIEILGHGPEGKERLLNRLGSGELFGEMALLDQTQRSASAIAREGAELFVITRDKVAELMQEVPEMALWMLKLFSRRLRLLTSMVSQMERVHEVNLKILAGQERERRRIGRDIHDGLAQFFADYIIRLQIADSLLDRDVDKARAELAELQAGLREGLEKLRELIYNLYPRELSRAGLVGAISQFVDRIAKSAGMDVVFEIQGLEEEFPAVLEATLYCIVQEALNNIKKHAQASKVSVALRCEDGQLTMAIADDGCGFDLEALLAEPSHHNTVGLLSMEERAKLAGGTMELHSHPGAGTTLRFRIPVRSCG